MDYVNRHEKTWAAPADAFTGDAREWFKTLIREGLQIADPRVAADLGAAIFAMKNNVKRHVLAVTRTGWQESKSDRGSLMMVLPSGKNIGGNSDVVFQSTDFSGKANSNIRTKGTLEDWQNQVGKLCVGNPRLAFTVAAAIASPLLLPLNQPNVMLHWLGTSSEGKTTALRVAGSVCGGSDDPAVREGYMRTWLATGNSLDAIAATHCDAVLALDELSNISAKDVISAIFRVYGGAEKARMTKDIALRDQRTWRTVLLSSGNVDPVTKAAQQSGNVRLQGTEEAAQSVRFLTLRATEGMYQFFDELHGFAGGAEFSNHLTAQSRQVYGTAYEAIIEAIVADVQDTIDRMTKLQDEIALWLLNGSSAKGGQVARVVQTFAFIAAAGEFAIEKGILPWPKGESKQAAKICFDSWMSARGTDGDIAVERGISQVRQYFQQYSDSRFVARYENPNPDALIDLAERSVQSRSGYRVTDGWLVYPDVFRNDIARGYDADAVLQSLYDRKLMARPYQTQPANGRKHGARCVNLQSPPGGKSKRERMFKLFRTLIEES
jgi:putative DNA primase/helicase